MDITKSIAIICRSHLNIHPNQTGITEPFTWYLDDNYLKMLALNGVRQCEIDNHVLHIYVASSKL